MQSRNLIWAVVIFIAGCASAAAPVAVAPVAVAPVVKADNPDSSEVSFTIHGKSYDEVWSEIERVAERNLTIVDSNKLFGTLKATRGVLMGPWGDVVIFSVKPPNSGAAEYSISLKSTNQPDSQLPTNDWAHTMVLKIKSDLGQ